MSMLLPWKSKPALTEDRLNFLAQQFREIFHGVESLLDTEDDCNYGRGALFFGRSRQRLIRLATSSDQPWLKLTNAGMDVTLEIGGIPFRFFRDDHDAPKKRGFWRRNESDRLFDPDDAEAVIFRFIVQRPIAETDDLDIYFVGYNATQEAVCEWQFGHVPVLHSTDEQLPEEVHQDAPHADLPLVDSQEAQANETKSK